jgi:hypothetical protein
MIPTATPQGWYPDPGGQPVWRWWTGTEWSPYWAPMAQALTPYQQSPVTLEASQARLNRPVAIGILVWVGIGIVRVLFDWHYAHSWANQFHWWHQIFDAGAGQPAQPRPPTPLPPWLALTSLVTITVEVFFFIWQYRAARVAKALGYPAKRSPGWGVGCWFVPVVNLWMPYQALRDCLPPGHAARRDVLSTWLLLVAEFVVASAVIVTLALAHSAGVVLVFVTLALEFGIGVFGYRAVTAIADDHRDAVHR